MEDSNGCVWAFVGLLTFATVVAIGGAILEWTKTPDGAEALGSAAQILAIGAVGIGVLGMVVLCIRSYGAVIKYRAEELRARRDFDAEVEEAAASRWMTDEQYIAANGPLPLADPVWDGPRRYEIWQSGHEYFIIPKIPEPGRLERRDLPAGAKRTHIIKAHSIPEARSKALACLGLVSTHDDELTLRKKPPPPFLADDLA